VIAIVVFLLTRDSASQTDGTVPTPSGSATATGVPPMPTGLKAAATPFKVVLTWRTGSGGSVSVSRYSVARDGNTLGLAPEGGHRFVDDTALPSQRYEYAVEAVGTDSSVSPAVKILVKTPKAPIAAARLEGVYNMKFNLTSSYGVHGFGNKTEGWRFTPSCAEGACNTKVRDIHWAKFTTDLHRSGASYTSTFGLTGYVYCRGTPASGTVTITIHVTKAEVASGTWQATAVAGTMRVSTVAQLGCTSSGLTYSLTGTVAG
jgi:hypothetical protein